MVSRLTPSDAPCPHCQRPMSRPTSERLTNPYCSACLPERMAAAQARWDAPQKRILRLEDLHNGRYS